MDSNKSAAVDFLAMINAGDIDAAYEKYVDMSGVHHNSFTPAGMAALRDGMKGAHIKFPDKQFTVLQVAADADLVAVHSHMILEPGKLDFATVHLFRFAGGKIVELWDLSQAVAADSPNTDGAF